MSLLSKLSASKVRRVLKKHIEMKGATESGANFCDGGRGKGDLVFYVSQNTASSRACKQMPHADKEQGARDES